MRISAAWAVAETKKEKEAATRACLIERMASLYRSGPLPATHGTCLSTSSRWAPAGRRRAAPGRPASRQTGATAFGASLVDNPATSGLLGQGQREFWGATGRFPVQVGLNLG